MVELGNEIEIDHLAVAVPSEFTEKEKNIIKFHI